MTYTVLGLGARFGGACVVCHQQTGNRHFELSDTLLLRIGNKGVFGVAHPKCAGWKTKTKISGGRVGSGPDTIEVPNP